MKTRFSLLTSEKQEYILNAALKEFACSGYERASTNEMVKEANIAKGSLFNYFQNKKDLYLFLLDYMDTFIDQIYDELDWNETDIFQRLKEIAFIKLRMYKRFPQAFEFLKAIAQEKAPEVTGAIEKRKEKPFPENDAERIYRNIDLTKFRDDLDLPKTINIIRWTALSFAEQLMKTVDSSEDVGAEHLREWDEYMDIMKRCFYKEDKSA